MRGDIDGLLERMDARLRRAVADDDPRGYFAAVYRAVTVRVRDGILAGEFEDGERMERFDVAFAGLYLDAADRYDRGEHVSASWQVAFDHARSPVLVLQHVLLGMNAHINLDLGVAAARTAPGDSITALRGDFDLLNDVLGEMVDRMQAAIATVSPWTAWVDAAGGRADEMISRWSVGRARSGAWRFATALAVSEDARTLVTRRDQAIAGIGRAIARPPLHLRLLVGLARLRETDDVGEVVRALGQAGASVPPPATL